MPACARRHRIAPDVRGPEWRPLGRARDAVARQLLVAERHDRADGRRRAALRVGEAGPDREHRAVGELALEGAEAALVLSGAGQVRAHARLGVVEGLHLEQREGAADLVARAGLAEHEPLAAERLDARELLAQVRDVAARVVGVGDEVLGAGARDVRAHGLEPRLERALVAGRVEEHVAKAPPRVAPVLPPHDAHGLLEALSPAEELAVERHALGQRVDEPRGRGDLVAEAGEEPRSVPVRAHAVELLAHPPAGEVALAPPRVGEEDRRRDAGRARARRARRGGALRAAGRAPYAGVLGRVAAERAEVLARATLDGDALVHPRRARARVDAADVLEEIGLGAGALDLARLAVGDVGQRGRRPCGLRGRVALLPVARGALRRVALGGRRVRLRRARRDLLPPRTLRLDHGTSISRSPMGGTLPTSPPCAA